MLAEHDAALSEIFRRPGALWHRTSLLSLESILKGGNLVPNSGQFPGTYPQSKNSYASRLPAVALFDFDAADDPDFIQYASAWESVLLGKLPGVAISIDRSFLNSEELLLPRTIINGDQRLAALGDLAKLTIIPGVEALYIGTIPTEAFNGYIMLGAKDEGGLRWQSVQSGANAIGSLSNIASTWEAERGLQEVARQATGRYTHAELVELSLQPDRGVEGDSS